MCAGSPATPVAGSTSGLVVAHSKVPDVFAGLRIAADHEITQPVRILDGSRNGLIAQAEIDGQSVVDAPVVLGIILMHVDLRLGHRVAGAAANGARQAEQHAGKAVAGIRIGLDRLVSARVEIDAAVHRIGGVRGEVAAAVVRAEFERMAADDLGRVGDVLIDVIAR